MTGQLRVTAASIIVIVLAVAAVALIGGYFSSMNRDWYDKLNYPPLKPPNWAFPVAWNIIFTLSIVSTVLIWNTRPHTGRTGVTIGLLILNGVINVVWSALFFGNRLILPAVIDAGLLFLSVIAIMIAAWPISRWASILLVPYAGWTGFATALTWSIWRLNT
jgi:tryptophan-rich sensory protein